MRRIARAGCDNLDIDEYAFATDRDGDPVHLVFVLARVQQIKAPGIKSLAGQPLGDIAHRNHAAAAKDDSFEFGSLVRKTKDPAGSDQLGYLRSRDGEAAFSEAQQHKRLRGSRGKILDGYFSDDAHCSCDPRGSEAVLRASAVSCTDSSNESSSSERKPSG